MFVEKSISTGNGIEPAAGGALRPPLTTVSMIDSFEKSAGSSCRTYVDRITLKATRCDTDGDKRSDKDPIE